MAAYVSEFTKFMSAWLKDHPEAEAMREEGIALWWNKPQDAESAQRQNVAKVPTQPYYYDNQH